MERDGISQNTKANSPVGAHGNWEFESCQKAKPSSASPACIVSASASSLPLPEPAASLHTHFAPGTNSVSWPLCPRSPPLGNGLCADTTQNLKREDLLGLDLLCLLGVLSLAVEPMGP